VIRVEAVDEMWQSSFGYSENFTISTAPLFTQQISNQSLYWNTSFSMQANGSDDDGDSISWAVNSSMLTINQSGFINKNWTTQYGNYSIRVNITDGSSTTNSTFNLEIKSYNSLPNIFITHDSAPVFGVSTTVYATGCPAELSCNFTLDGSLISSPYTFTPSSNVYSFDYITSSNHNYSAHSVQYLMNVSSPGGSETFTGGGNSIPVVVNFSTTNITNTINTTSTTNNTVANSTVDNAVDIINEYLPDIYGTPYTREQLENLGLAAFFVVFIIGIALFNTKINSSSSRKQHV
jgi:hypothetical protein